MRLRAAIHVILVLTLWGALIYASSQPYQQQDLRPWIARHVAPGVLEKHAGHLSFTYGRKEVSVGAEGAAGFVEFFIRKGAHCLTFAALALLLYRTLRHWLPPAVAFPWSALLALLTAVLDEWHQTYTPGRTGMVADVLLDAASSFAVLAVIALWQWRSRFRRVKG